MFLSSVIHAIRRYIQSRSTERALSQLDDRMLADIGLTRSRIKSAVADVVR